ncbi:MAG: TerC family protein [Vulcanibacillus sp.]
MEIFTSEFISGLLSIVLIDLVLGGDNAILIALATRKLPQEHRKKAIFWGVVGAIIVRAGMTVIAIYILKIPLIKFVGGVLLIWIAYKLLIDNSKHEEVNSGKNVSEAIKTIIFADLLMGIDNILAIAGAARGDILLVILGLLISIPIIVWGSSIILRFIDRFPIIIYIGSGVIAYTAGKMIVEDIWMHDKVFSQFSGSELAIPIAIVVIVLLLGYFKRSKREA